MIERMDYEAVEAAEAALDQFIEKRAKAADEQRRIEEAWALSARRHRECRRERNRELWRIYHLERAKSLERIAAELAASHRARAEALVDEGGGVVNGPVCRN